MLLRPHVVPRRHTVRNVTFFSEQDGVPERMLKERLVRQLSHTDDIKRAYLVKAELDGRPCVVLALRGGASRADRIAAFVGPVFMDLFRTDQRLYTLFVDEEQEAAIATVCTPFMQRAPWVHGGRSSAALR